MIRCGMQTSRLSEATLMFGLTGSLALAACGGGGGGGGSGGSAVPSSSATTSSVSSSGSGSGGGASGGTGGSTSASTGTGGAMDPGTLLGDYYITYYWLVEETDYTGPDSVDLLDANCKAIAKVPQAFAADVCVEGSGKLAEGAVINYDTDCSCGFQIGRAHV